MAWAPWFSHEYITYFAAQAIGQLIKLPQVPVKPNPIFDNRHWPNGPDHIDFYKESFHDKRRIDPFCSFDYQKRNGEFITEPPINLTIDPWKILVIYSTEPDHFLDVGLSLHKYQKITGGSHGWRHMQFRLPGIKFGIAPKSFHHSMDLSKKAFLRGNEYWGWRFLSRATHYLADLGNPFHVKAAPLDFLIKYVFSFNKLVKIISAIHQSYEVYAERRFREEFIPFKEALMNGACEGYASSHDISKQLNVYIHRAETRLPVLFNYIISQFGKELISVFDDIDQKRPEDVSFQTMKCSAATSRIIFRKSGQSALEFLDMMTVDILFDVGILMGILIKNYINFTQLSDIKKA